MKRLSCCLSRSGMSGFSIAPLFLLALLVLGFLIGANPAQAMGAYKTEPAYDNYPLRGPDKAKGLIIWNHGLYGTMTQYTAPPPFIAMAMAARGWDVIKLDRNPTYENGWTNAGQRHIARLIEEAEAARKAGYARVILAGQSYGGAIALEAARAFPAYAVIAMAPSTGQEIRNNLIADTWTQAIVDETYAEISDLKTQRAILVMPVDDEYLRGADRAPRARELLDAKNISYLMVDKQVHGHGGGYTKEFIPYASCAMWLLDPTTTPKPGEFHCYQDEAKPAIAALGLNPVNAIGAWFGYGEGTGQEITVVQKNGAAGPTVELGWGTGLFSTFKLGNDSYRAAQADNVLSFAAGNAFITLNIAGQTAKFTETRKDKSEPVLATLMTLAR